MEKDDECCVCYNNMKGRVKCLYECNHSVCVACQLTLYEHGHMTCPQCRELIRIASFQGKHQVFIRNLNGRSIVIPVNIKKTTTNELFYIVSVKTGCQRTQMRLSYNGRQLHYNCMLGDLGIVKSATIHLNLKLSGD